MDNESENEVATMYHMKASIVTLFNIHDEIVIPRDEPIRKEPISNGQNVTYEEDTGCGYTIMSRRTFAKIFDDRMKPKLVKCGIKLRTYSGHKVPIFGAAKVKVQFIDIVKMLAVVVIKGSGTSLLGQGWIKALK